MKKLRTMTAILAMSGFVGLGLMLSACPGEDTAVDKPDTGPNPTATPTPTPTPTPTTTTDGGPKPKTSCLDRPTDFPRAPTTGLPCELIPPGLVLK